MRPIGFGLLLALAGVAACDKDSPTPAPPPAGEVVAGDGSGEDEGGDDGASSYDPCAGKSCGDECTLCAPADPDCVETMVVKVCDAAGACDATVPECP